MSTRTLPPGCSQSPWTESALLPLLRTALREPQRSPQGSTTAGNAPSRACAAILVQCFILFGT